jgi:hypothetical protein
VLDQLLVVLMLVEILHTVRISIHSHTLVTEPFPVAPIRLFQGQFVPRVQ